MDQFHIHWFFYVGQSTCSVSRPIQQEQQSDYAFPTSRMSYTVFHGRRIWRPIATIVIMHPVSTIHYTQCCVKVRTVSSTLAQQLYSIGHWVCLLRVQTRDVHPIWYIGGPPSEMLTQHCSSIGWMCRVCWKPPSHILAKRQRRVWHLWQPRADKWRR